MGANRHFAYPPSMQRLDLGQDWQRSVHRCLSVHSLHTRLWQKQSLTSPYVGDEGDEGGQNWPDDGICSHGLNNGP
jgi:hypothetical protein